MISVQTLIYLGFITLEILGVSTAVEFYKKGIRKDKAGLFEIKTIAFFLSVIAIGLLVILNIFQPLIGLIGAPFWADFLLYVFLFYTVQRVADMKLIKKAFKSMVKPLLVRAGLNEEQIDAILTGVKLTETSEAPQK